MRAKEMILVGVLVAGVVVAASSMLYVGAMIVMSLVLGATPNWPSVALPDWLWPTLRLLLLSLLATGVLWMLREPLAGFIPVAEPGQPTAPPAPPAPAATPRGSSGLVPTLDGMVQWDKLTQRHVEGLAEALRQAQQERNAALKQLEPARQAARDEVHREWQAHLNHSVGSSDGRQIARWIRELTEQRDALAHQIAALEKRPPRQLEVQIGWSAAQSHELTRRCSAAGRFTVDTLLGAPLPLLVRPITVVAESTFSARPDVEQGEGGLTPAVKEAALQPLQPDLDSPEGREAAILELVHSGTIPKRDISLMDLAEQLGVSRPTLYADRERLKDQGKILVNGKGEWHPA